MKKILSIMALMLSFSYPSFANDPMVIVTYGGAWEKAQYRAMVEPFTLKTDRAVVTEPKANYALAKLKAMVDTNNVSWDVIDMLPQDAIVACEEGLLEPIDHNTLLKPAADGTKPLDDYFAAGLSKCAVPTVSYSILFAYDPKTFPNGGPQNLQDVFDVERFPGKRGLQKKPINNLEWALHADGVPLDRVYDVLATDDGLNRAFAKLDTIKDHIVWWKKGSQSPQMIYDGEVAIASGYNGRFFTATVEEGREYNLIWDAQLFNTTVWVIPKGKLTDDVKMFLHDAASPEAITMMSRIIATGPARISAANNATTHLDSGISLTPFLPTAKQNMFNMAERNGQWWAERNEMITRRFNAWLEQ